jgi:hypothetical protein
MNRFLTLSFLVISLTASFSLFSQELQLTKRRHELTDKQMTLIQDSETPRKIHLTVPHLYTYTYCSQSNYSCWDTTCEDCHQVQTCSNDNDGNNVCSYTWDCTSYACTKCSDDCVEYKSEPRWGKVELILRLKNSRRTESQYKFIAPSIVDSMDYKLVPQNSCLKVEQNPKRKNHFEIDHIKNCKLE